MSVGYQVEGGPEPGDRSGSVTPKGVWGLQDRGALLRRRFERSISGWWEPWGPQNWGCRGLEEMQEKLAKCFR